MAIDRKTVRNGDTIYVAFAGCNYTGPFAWVRGGTVVAAGGDGSLVYQTEAGHVDSVPAWTASTVHATEAEAWSSAADQLAAIADQVVTEVADCRKRASGQGVTA